MEARWTGGRGRWRVLGRGELLGARMVWGCAQPFPWGVIWESDGVLGCRTLVGLTIVGSSAERLVAVVARYSNRLVMMSREEGLVV